MRNLNQVLESAGAHLADNEPASTLLGVSILGYPNQLVEVEVEAVAAL